MQQADQFASGAETARAVLRHLVARIAYRAAKVLRGAPPDFGALSVGSASRRPTQIVAHLADLMMWAVTLSRGENAWNAGGANDWDTEVQRFVTGLAALDRELTREGPMAGSVERLIQGPLADALTHVGQLALLRGMAGAPVRPENYARAEVTAGSVGLDQAAPRREFDGDASTRRV